MIKTKPGFLLRRLGDESMVIAIGEASESFNGMIRLNSTGVFYWELLEQGATEDLLVAKTLEHFDGPDEATARQDVQEFLQTISMALDFDAKDH